MIGMATIAPARPIRRSVAEESFFASTSAKTEPAPESNTIMSMTPESSSSKSFQRFAISGKCVVNVMKTPP